MNDIIFEKTNNTGVITFNREKHKNCLNARFIENISQTIDSALEDSDIYVLIFTGTGDTFSAGADVREMLDKDSDQIYEWSAFGSYLNLKIENLPIPTIAAINGYAFGGGLELALACDLRIASDTAVMGLTETGLGTICGAGGTQRLPKIIGSSRAKDLIFTGRHITADEALGIGLVNRVVSHDELRCSALSLAGAICKNSQPAVRLAKEAIAYSENTITAEGCLAERRLFAQTFETEDQKIGMTAFVNKEKNIKFNNR
jgi:enoyl-CoA hydratase